MTKSIRGASEGCVSAQNEGFYVELMLKRHFNDDLKRLSELQTKKSE